MAFDANGILKGLYGGVLVAMDENDTVATSKTANSDGNAVVEIDKTGAKGLAAVVIYTEAADSSSYDDEAVITIEASDYLDKNWETVVTFPTMHTHIAELTVTATTGFAAADITQAMTQETTADTGQLLWYDPVLETAGGIGKIWVERDDSGDIFNEVAGKTVNNAGTGRATKTYGAGTTRLFDMQPAVYIRRFTTNKKYVRCNCESVDDSYGKVWILLTDAAFDKI
jgi:hypothetical protein